MKFINAVCSETSFTLLSLRQSLRLLRLTQRPLKRFSLAHDDGYDSSRFALISRQFDCVRDWAIPSWGFGAHCLALTPLQTHRVSTADLKIVTIAPFRFAIREMPLLDWQNLCWNDFTGDAWVLHRLPARPQCHCSEHCWLGGSSSSSSPPLSPLCLSWDLVKRTLVTFAI